MYLTMCAHMYTRYVKDDTKLVISKIEDLAENKLLADKMFTLTLKINIWMIVVGVPLIETRCYKSFC